jgi:hypothetical protein
MILKKYERWPQLIIDEIGQVWRRSKTKGWFEFVEYDDRKRGGGYCSRSKFLNHPDFIGAKKVYGKKEAANFS